MPRSALVLIARDEAQCISRCLESVSSLVDEMIVVDKGSSDNTADLARNAGARVHSFSQCDQALTRSGPQWNCGGGFSRYQILPSSLTQNW